MNRRDIPKAVMDQIQKAAEDAWRDDPEKKEEMINAELGAYIKLQESDFGVSPAVKQAIMDSAIENEFIDTWEERLSTVEGEVEAFHTLQTIEIEKVPSSVLKGLKHDAEREHPGDYSAQRDYVVNGANSYLYIQELRAKVGPIKELLIKMERLIGSECYNANIQNYGPGGVWEGEGRSFRYPVTFIKNGGDQKHWTVSSDTDPEVLITGRYKFGANDLNIFRALLKIVEMLETEYGVDLGKRR